MSQGLLLDYNMYKSIVGRGITMFYQGVAQSLIPYGTSKDACHSLRLVQQNNQQLQATTWSESFWQNKGGFSSLLWSVNIMVRNEED